MADIGEKGCETDDTSGPKEAWYVVQTKRYHEASTQARLQAEGLGTYLPRALRWPRPAVGALIGPLFPTYLFVSLQLARDYQAVCRTPGVKDFIRLGGTLPSEVPDDVIAFLHRREGKDGLVRCSHGVEPRRTVTITRGALKDLSGIVDRTLTGRDRVILLMELLRRQVRVEVPQAFLREVG